MNQGRPTAVVEYDGGSSGIDDQDEDYSFITDSQEDFDQDSDDDLRNNVFMEYSRYGGAAAPESARNATGRPAAQPQSIEQSRMAAAGRRSSGVTAAQSSMDSVAAPAKVVEVSREDFECHGMDMQAIQWNPTQLDAHSFREIRRKHYREFGASGASGATSAGRRGGGGAATVKTHDLSASVGGETTTARNNQYYRFNYTRLTERCTILHGQLRNLICAASKHDIFYAKGNSIIHWNPTISASGKSFIDFSRYPHSTPTIFRVAALFARYDALLAVGFFGEVCCKLLETSAAQPPQFSVISETNNSLNNYADICYRRSGALETAVSSNDHTVRFLDIPTLQPTDCFKFDWPVNCALQNPAGQLLAAVGDSPECVLVDQHTGSVVERLNYADASNNHNSSNSDCHELYGFAVQWSPDDRHLVAASQDGTVRIYDCRNWSKPFCHLQSRMASVRSLRFTSDGKLLIMAESADFVHLLDVQSEYSRWQTVELLGEIGGVCLTPDDQSLFIGCSDDNYGGIIEFVPS